MVEADPAIARTREVLDGKQWSLLEASRASVQDAQLPCAIHGILDYNPLLRERPLLRGDLSSVIEVGTGIEAAGEAIRKSQNAPNAGKITDVYIWCTQEYENHWMWYTSILRATRRFNPSAARAGNVSDR